MYDISATSKVRETTYFKLEVDFSAEELGDVV